MKDLFKINSSLEYLIVPVLTTLVSSFLFVGLYRYAQPKIAESFSKIQSSQVEVNILESRLSVLKKFDDNSFGRGEDLAVLSLPKNNSGAVKIMQTRLELESASGALKSVESRPPTDFQDTIKKADVVYVFESSDLSRTLNFLSNLSISMPASTIEEVKMTRDSADILKFEVKTAVYWAPFPKELPSFDSPLNDLTEEERQLQAKMSQYKFPTNDVLAPSQEVVVRENPFN